MWRKAAARQADIQDFEHGIDRESSQALLHANSTQAIVKSALRKFLSGDPWSQVRAYRVQMQPRAVCPFCQAGEQDELQLVARSGIGIASWSGFKTIPGSLVCTPVAWIARDARFYWSRSGLLNAGRLQVSAARAMVNPEANFRST